MWLLLACARPVPSPPPLPEGHPSDAVAAELTDALVRLYPERSVELGVARSDDATADWGPAAADRARLELERQAALLHGRAEAERDPAVAFDLRLLEDAVGRELLTLRLDQAEVPLLDPAAVVSDGVGAALDASEPGLATARLRRYVGQGGTPPLAVQAADRTRESLARSAVRVPRDAIDRQLTRTPLLLGGLRDASAGVPDAGPLLDVLEAQLADYDAFVRAEVWPRAPEHAAPDPARYRLALDRAGIDADPDVLARDAHHAFDEIIAEMKPLAAEIAAAHGWPDPDYRAVLRELKRDRVSGEALEQLYRDRIGEIDRLLRAHELVTLPARPLAFRMATDAESGWMPAPMYLPPPPEHPDAPGTFVLPVGDAAAGGAAYDDFDFREASWWLAAHEGRPGHDLQWATMAEHPPSVARRRYAPVSAAAEGWGLYAESLIAPYVPPEARLVILDARLMRAAHAFLDVETNLGRIGPDEVRRVMVDEVGFSPAWADTCVLRYGTLMPGQAPSYFYGYQRLIALRDEARERAGDRFDLRAFHDAVLAQGLVLPDLTGD